MPVDIEANTEPGFSGVPLVVISGASAGSGANGLTLASGSSGSTIEGLVVNGFGGDGIDIASTNDSVIGCYIGTNAAGTAAVANEYGIGVNASGATIGGTTTGDANIIAGNDRYGVDIEASSCLVVGNDIGTNAAGTAAVANYGGIAVSAPGATIGGTITSAGNIISGNSDAGVAIVASSCLVEGNFIGTNAAGTGAVANYQGILVVVSGATIGGATPGAGNVISGNLTIGVFVDASCLLEGNDIGTNAAGTAAVANYEGIDVDVSGSGATIGGTTAGAGNVISGNTLIGVEIDASPFLVEGNDIGTNAAGSAVANAVGITVSTPGATIGGTASGAGNTISDNSQVGIEVESGAAVTITNDSITGDGTGVLVGNWAGETCVVTAQDDDLSGNTTAGITNNQTNPAYAVTATDDWWGSLHGPTTTANQGGDGSSISSNVSFSPWIGVYTPGTGPGFQPAGVTLYAVPTQLVFVTEPSSTAFAGFDFATQPVVEAEDTSGNLGINFDATTVSGAQAVMTLNTDLGVGTLAGTTSVSPSGGFASFGGLNIAGSGTFTLTASASGFGSLNLSGTSGPIQVSAPASYAVTSTADSGPGTFRAVITALDSSSGSPVTSRLTSARRASRRSRWRRRCRQLRCRSTSRGIPSRGSPACRWW